METEAEMGEMQPQPVNSGIPGSHQKPGQRPRASSPEGTSPANPSILDSGLQNCEKINLLF